MTDFMSAKSDLRKGEKERVSQTGKTPYFHSNQQVRSKVLEGKFDKLQKSGKVEAEIVKHRKHQAAKEKKMFIPRTRRNFEDPDNQ